MDSQDGIVTGVHISASRGKVAERITRRLPRCSGGVSPGFWSGKDTCWRMALDIARCVVHTRSDGVLSPECARKHLAIADGVIGGEGNGPLTPTPVRSGWVFFSRDPFAADDVNSIATGHDSARIPLVSRASGIAEFPITDIRPEDVRCELGQEDLLPSHPSGRVTIVCP
jgi:hypothetical protein